MTLLVVQATILQRLLLQSAQRSTMTLRSLAFLCLLLVLDRHILYQHFSWLVKVGELASASFNQLQPINYVAHMPSAEYHHAGLIRVVHEAMRTVHTQHASLKKLRCFGPTML